MNSQDLLSQRRLRVWIRLLRMIRSKENRLREFLRVNFDTTLPRFDVMAALYRSSAPMKMSGLSKLLLVSNGNATAVVDRLIKEGLVIRVPSEDDRRLVLVSLTKIGREQFVEQAEAHKAEVNKAFASLGNKDLNMLRDLLKTIENDNDDATS